MSQDKSSGGGRRKRRNNQQKLQNKLPSDSPEKETLSSEAEKLREENNELKQEISSLKKENTDLKAQVSDLQTRMKEMLAQMSQNVLQSDKVEEIGLAVSEGNSGSEILGTAIPADCNRNWNDASGLGAQALVVASDGGGEMNTNESGVAGGESCPYAEVRVDKRKNDGLGAEAVAAAGDWGDEMNTNESGIAGGESLPGSEAWDDTHKNEASTHDRQSWWNENGNEAQKNTGYKNAGIARNETDHTGYSGQRRNSHGRSGKLYAGDSGTYDFKRDSDRKPNRGQPLGGDLQRNFNKSGRYTHSGDGEEKYNTDRYQQNRRFENKERGWGRGKFRGENRRDSPQNEYKGRGPREHFSQSHPNFVLKEIDGDLFTAPKNYSLAHCVAQDLRMGSGIAVTFRQDFGRVDELLEQRKKVGEVAVLHDNDRYIYYLITKRFSNGKPMHEDLETSLYAMKKHCEENGVREIAMPRIGCGLDRLKWRDVRRSLEKVFSDLDVVITVYNFTEGFGKHLREDEQSLSQEKYSEKSDLNKDTNVNSKHRKRNKHNSGEVVNKKKHKHSNKRK